MEKHVRILGWLYIGRAILYLFVAALIFVVASGASVLVGLAEGDFAAVAIGPIVALAVAAFMTLLAIPGLIGGMGLLNYRPWARTVIIVIAFFNLLDIPLGTGLAIYSLWVLLKHDSDYLFREYDGGYEYSYDY